jgi:hypothetical protein
MALPLSQVSRYVKTPLVSFDGKETYTKWTQQGVFTTRPPENKITKYQVSQIEAGRPDLVALSVYNNSKFDWVIIAFNNPKSIFGWPKPLEVIEYPDLNLVLGDLL